MKLLITFGCSWTYGVGVNYNLGMSKPSFKAGAWNDELAKLHSFRGVLSSRYNLDNINFAQGGSSNQRQFRLAENFFGSSKFQSCRNQYKEIVVLWCITSVLRNEAYFITEKLRKSFFYNDGSLLSKTIVTNHFDQQHEILLLGKKIQFWDNVFDSFGIKNIWVDTFNHHHYTDDSNMREKYLKIAGKDWPSWENFVVGNFTNVPDTIQLEILDQTRWDFHECCKPISNRMFGHSVIPRDLLSQLAIRNGMTVVDHNNYHQSGWNIDCNRVKYLTDIGLLNPYSNHPTKSGHIQIADMLSAYFE
jgi:hypothetical protein